jgi:molybdenum cofactor biosynthesis enzyme MoaA
MAAKKHKKRKKGIELFIGTLRGVKKSFCESCAFLRLKFFMNWKSNLIQTIPVRFFLDPLPQKF